MTSPPAPPPSGRLAGLLGGPSLAVGAGQVVLLVLAWTLLLGAEPPRGGLLVAVWFGGGAVAGLVDGAVVLYGGRTRSLRGRLVLGGLRFDGAGARAAVVAGSLLLGNVLGRLLVPGDVVEEATGLASVTAPLIAVLAGVIGALGGIVLLLLVVMPVGFVIASFLRPRDDEPPVNVFGVMSVGELRGGGLVLLGIAWLFPGLIFATTGIVDGDTARGWLASCGVAVLLVIVGVVVNNRAVARRNRAGIVTPFDQGLRGLRRRRR
jgi:hypothetical protein